MAVLGHHNGFTRHNTLENGTSLLSQLPYAYKVTHWEHMVAQ